MAQTKTIGGKRYTQSTCHTTKGAAKARALSARTRGNRARVLKSGKRYCVFTGGRSKRKAR